MSYKKFLDTQLTTSPQLEKILELLNNLKGKKILTFTHDDPDGVTAGAVFKRLTDKLGIENKVFLPPKFEVTQEELELAIKQTFVPEAIFIIDKGTIENYKNFVSLTKKIVVIDHHPAIGKNFDNLLVYNPSLKVYTQCCGSFLVHNISTLLNCTTEIEDFLSLVGLRSDWSIDPMNNNIPEFVKPFFEDKIQPKFKNLITPKEGLKPTMFEISDRKKTCVLNQIAELVFALTGGGFQYFYNDYDEKLKNINQPEFCFQIFVKGFEVKDYVSLEQFIDTLPQKEVVNLIFKYYAKDWHNTELEFDKNTIFAGKINDVLTFMFFGKQTRLMPMVGSIKLYEFLNGKEGIIFMINIEQDGGVHISFRGNTDKVHLGTIASTIATNLVNKFGFPQEITGGGHPRAAELKTRKSGVSYIDVMKEFFKLL
jgi:oligoribonuclease NrnB/cAMP/cGMP phosphodiesterase (DHH superfamily)